MKKLAPAALTLLATTAATHAAQVAFGLSPTTPPTSNPAYLVHATPGQQVTLYIWAARTDTTPGNFVNALGFDIKAVLPGTSNSVPLPNVSFTWDNPSTTITDPDSGERFPLYRWDATIAPDYNVPVNGNTLAVHDARAFTQVAFPAGTFSPVTTMRKVATLTFTAPTQFLDLYLGVSPFWISESHGTTTSTFGFGDSPIPSLGARSDNTFSLLPDAVPFPEPASLTLTALPALTLAARRPPRSRRA